MGGNAVKISRPVTFEEAKKTIKWIKEEVFPRLTVIPIEDKDTEILGSYGKKKDGATHGDIDIAVLNIPEPNSMPKNVELDLLRLDLEGLGFETKVNYGFRIVSFGCPIGGSKSLENCGEINLNMNDLVQVDLMLTTNLYWSRFIYHSPDFRKEESKYKGYYRNILLMALITEPTKEITKTTEDGEVEEIEVNILRYPFGISRVRKNFMGKKGLLKNGKNVEGFDFFITNDPQEVTDLTVGEHYKPSDINTFEKLWDIVMSPNFKWINKREGIIKRFIECLDEQKLTHPTEIKEYDQNELE
ncbi:MAG TPA: hypothetical protein PK122_00380 [Candidatus Paceibacterota bacterium]|nr:hypothetical protein [Candidatus Paceibacterota bacterium]